MDLGLDREQFIEYILTQKTDEVNTSKEVEIGSAIDFQESVKNCLYWTMNDEGVKKDIYVVNETIVATYDIKPLGDLTVKLSGHFNKEALSFIIDVLKYNM